MYDSPEVAAQLKERSSLGRNPLSCSKARYYNPQIGRFISEDESGFQEASSFYSYARNNPIVYFDPLGEEAHQPGGPYHPPKGVKIRCTWDDDCPLLEWKLLEWRKVLEGHAYWDAERGSDRHANEMMEILAGISKCQRIYDAKCRKCEVCEKLKEVAGPALAAAIVRQIIVGMCVIAGL